MLRTLCLSLILGSVCFSAPLAAEEASLLTLSRAEAVELALRDNLSLRAARLAVAEAEARVIDSGRLANPALTLSGSTDAPFQNEGEESWSVGLQQSFPITSRLRMLREIAELEVELARLEIKQAELATAYEIEKRVNAIIDYDRRLSRLGEQTDLVNRLRDFLERKVDRAEASPLDVRQLRIESAALQQEFGRWERKRTEEVRLLAVDLGLSADQAGQLMLDGRVMAPPRDLPPFDRAELARHPQYALKQKLSEIAARRTTLALAERWADITAEFVYEEGKARDEPDGLETERFIGFGVTIPLPVHNRNEGAIRSGQFREERTRLDLESVGDRLLAEAEALRARHRSLADEIDAFRREVIEASSQHVKDLESAYAAGQVDLTQLLRAQEKQLEHRKELLELESEGQDGLARWRLITGRLLTTKSEIIKPKMGDSE